MVTIEISTVAEEGSPCVGEEDAAILELAPGDGCEAEGPVRYDLVVQKLGGQLLVTGRVSAVLRLPCARCAEMFSTTVADSSFLRDYLLQVGQREVDLTPDLREAILLELPRFAVCRENCAGLCPQCGKNLNQGACGCRPPPARGAWSALDGLRI